MLLAVPALGALLMLLWRRTSRQPCKLPPSEVPYSIPLASSVSEAVQHIRCEGVTIMEAVLDPETVESLRSKIADVEPRKLQNRRQHRWEHVHSPDAPPLAELAAHPTLKAVVRAILGPKHYLEKAGLVVSHHGAEAQRWHMDTPHLFSCGPHLPAHSLTVFVPLCELHRDNGPTEYQLATHIKANLVQKHRHACASCPVGSFVLYDPRIMHRGGPNQSNNERALVYLTFSRVWYRDTLNP